MMKKKYSVVTIKNLGFLAGGLIVLILGILAAVFAEASVVGIIILLLAVGTLSGILMSVAIESLLARYNIKKNTIRIMGDVFFVNRVKNLNVLDRWRLVKFVGDLNLLLPMEVVSELDDDINECRRSPSFDMTQEIPCFKPITMIFFKKPGSVIWRWGSIEKKVSGLQIGNNVEIELTLDDKDRMISLIKHELGHRFLSWRYPLMSTAEQHDAMAPRI